MSEIKKHAYDVIVIGGGHAGIEAAVAPARMGCSVGLITMDAKAIGRMSCNPAIGGTAKGHLVREIDALGGVMGEVADETGIQFRMLNRSKGPAVWSPRCQSDRELYAEAAQRVVFGEQDITIIDDAVSEIIVQDKKVRCVRTQKGIDISCKAVIIASGTFLNGLMYTGLAPKKGGRFGEKAAYGLTENLLGMGFVSGRLKTGTPPRLKKPSIDFRFLEEHSGDEKPQPFSFRTDRKHFPQQRQISCHMGYTNPEVHSILRKGFDESPMFLGTIKGKGPRYCPSIEDKIVRFSERNRHQLFLEPEGLDSDLIYLNGFSSSLPAHIQLEALRKIKGLGDVEMARPGYAVEYDFFPSHQVNLTLETKLVGGLYFAGQINGTSGYEEAAAQGLIAGINAALKIQKRGEFTLTRQEAYIGVLIDDLVNKSTDEPYRMFTSHAEHRLILRQDNADRRLMSYGWKFGLIPGEAYRACEKRKRTITQGTDILANFRLAPGEINGYLNKIDTSEIRSPELASILCRRPQVSLSEILKYLGSENHKVLNPLKVQNAPLDEIEIEIKYEGYITREKELICRMEKLEEKRIPYDFDYQKIIALSHEGQERLSQIKPRSIGQATRISGVSPTDISILMVHLKKTRRN